MTSLFNCIHERLRGLSVSPLPMKANILEACNPVLHDTSLYAFGKFFARSDKQLALIII